MKNRRSVVALGCCFGVWACAGKASVNDIPEPADDASAGAPHDTAGETGVAGTKTDGGPAARGAFWAHLSAISPPIPGKTCPSGSSLTFDLPAVDPTLVPPQALDQDTYVQKIIDGEDSAEVKCAVKGSSAFTAEGTMKLAAVSFALSQGTLGADSKGTGTVTLRKVTTPGFSNTLSAPAQTCVLDAAAAAGNAYQVKAGSIWGHFSCASVQAAPSDQCAAEGYFVFENCSQ